MSVFIIIYLYLNLKYKINLLLKSNKFEMSSEDQKLKPEEKEDSHVMKINIEKNEPKIRRKAIMPFINYKKINIFSISIINYFAIGICLFIYGYINLEWFNSEYYSGFFIGYYLISGIVLYIIGIFDWYEGKDLAFLVDFVFSFYFISLFLREIKMGDITNNNTNNKLHGTFYAIIFCFTFFIAISYKNKGKIYMINYIILFCGYLVLFFYKYIEADLILKISSFIFVVSGVLFWITGILKIIDNSLNEKTIKILRPNDD